MDVDVMAAGDAVQFETTRCQQGLEILEADVGVVACTQSTEKFAWSHGSTVRAVCRAMPGLPSKPVDIEAPRSLYAALTR